MRLETYVKDGNAIYLVGWVVFNLNQSLRFRPGQIVVCNVSMFIHPNSRFTWRGVCHVGPTSKMRLLIVHTVIQK